MNDHALLVVAVVTSVANAVASIARTIWHYEKRRAFKHGKG